MPAFRSGENREDPLRSPGEVCRTQALSRIYKMDYERMDFRRPAPFEK
jgi:hypothetical protein